MTLSLCIIAGNESDKIVRMLDSFAQAFDELSLVRAIGGAEGDNTHDLARDWCEQHGKRFVFSDYVNAPPTANWPHVDDFAAARNQSFAQANGDWLFWADCDDIIGDAAELRRVIESAEPAVVLLRFPYEVPQVATTTQRERAIRRDTFGNGRRWQWPVHENLLVYPTDRWINLDGPAWIHQPTGKKAGGEKRNLRLLSHALRDAPAHYYYCHQENFHLRNPQQARRFGDLFLSLPGGNPTMRYRCLLNMAQMAEMKDEATTYALRAHHLFPRQKEAIAALVECSFQEENAERALYWADRLMATPPPPVGDRIWCYEPKWNGWHGTDLLIRALRYAGKESEATRLEYPLPSISLLHATRGRVREAIQCRKRFYDTATNPAAVEHIFAIDDDDAISKRWLKCFRHVISPQPTCVAAWNAAAYAACGDILVQLSDDWLPFPGWDTELLKAIGDRDPITEEFVVAVSDGTRTDPLMCMAICSAERYRKQGHLFAPDYESMFSDNEFTHRAYKDGVVIEARHLVFEHMHPAFGKGQMDETYKRQNAPEKYQRGMETFNRRNPEAALIG